MIRRPSVLVFSGVDPSAGAGMQADIQAIAAIGAHPLSVVTALTVQDNDHVFAVHPIPALLLKQQAEALINKIEIAAVKIGIIANRANAEAIVAIVHELKKKNANLPVVFDPVLASGHGDALAVENAIQIIAPLIGIATLITPNLPEASALCSGDRRADAQAENLLRCGCKHVLIKGGHGSGSGKIVNQWFTKDHSRSWSWPRLQGAFHGSGCTLASAIAALLANGKSMEQAIDLGQAYCQQTLERSYAIAEGQRIPDRFIPSFIDRERR
jgi:hydroxymethylpyrimidine/phosphomethylpyrimidine kinase